MDVITKGKMPHHVAIIMDGNGRWAKKRNQPRLFGHKKGAERVREAIKTSGEIGVKVLTLFAFSDENWNRPEDEVNGLFNLLTMYIKKELHVLKKNNIRLSIIGQIEKVPASCRELLIEATGQTQNNDGLHLVLALSYGGRSDILKSVRSLAKQVQSGDLTPDEISEKLLTKNLYTEDIPDPDLLIRTSGEQRISNFLLWQMAYTELFFSQVMWPDFSKEEYLNALEWFQTRERRFGRVAESDKATNKADLPC